MFRKLLDRRRGRRQCRPLLRGLKQDDIERGQVIAKPGSIKPHTKFNAEVYVLSKEEGGRHTPFFNGYRPQFYFRTTDVTGSIKLPEGVEMVMPGDNVTMTVELITPIAMEKTMRFAIREGGRTVGAGQWPISSINSPCWASGRCHGGGPNAGNRGISAIRRGAPKSPQHGSSSIGRASVSKTECWGFESPPAVPLLFLPNQPIPACSRKSVNLSAK